MWKGAVDSCGKTNAMDLVEKLYGTTRREGLDKYSVEHPRDVVDFCFLDLQEDNIRILRLLNVAILHDGGVTPRWVYAGTGEVHGGIGSERVRLWI